MGTLLTLVMKFRATWQTLADLVNLLTRVREMDTQLRIGAAAPSGSFVRLLARSITLGKRGPTTAPVVEGEEYIKMPARANSRTLFAVFDN